MLITIDNKKESSVGGKWGNPGATLYDRLMDASNYLALLKETYLVGPPATIKNDPHQGRTSFTGSGVGYPHHVVRNGKLVIHRAGLRAAYSRAEQQGIVKGEIEAHLIRHYKEMGWYEQSTISEDELQQANFDDNTLQHYGVLGMKWGVHRDRGSDGRVTRTPESSRKRELQKTPIAQMTNKDLREYIERANLERQYKDLKKRDISSGRKFVQETLREVAKEFAKEFIKGKIKGA